MFEDEVEEEVLESELLKAFAENFNFVIIKKKTYNKTLNTVLEKSQDMIKSLKKKQRKKIEKFQFDLKRQKYEYEERLRRQGKQFLKNFDDMTCKLKNDYEKEITFLKEQLMIRDAEIKKQQVINNENRSELNLIKKMYEDKIQNLQVTINNNVMRKEINV